MKIAFVGIGRDFSSVRDEIGVSVDDFTHYHLEIPYYYAKYTDDEVTIVTDKMPSEVTDGIVNYCKTSELRDKDIVVHWRSWQQYAYDACSDAIHLLHTCDHSYSNEWKITVANALRSGALTRIICYETWHVENMMRELSSVIEPSWDNVVTQLTLGVDTMMYRPKEKDEFKLLWASDPGRGLAGCLSVFNSLWKLDRRYVLHILCPDYALGNMLSVVHPSIRIHRFMKNGNELWDMFNTAAFVPYTSVFKEPSSRVHRQAQAAGCCLLYPDDMGSPSRLIIDGRNGYLMDKNFNPDEWAKRINNSRVSGEYKTMGYNSRLFAMSEDWKIQATRFNLMCNDLLSYRRKK